MRAQGRWYARFAALLALAALGAMGSRAQSPQQAPAPPPPQVSPNDKGTIRSTVDLVQVDVQVTGRDGKAVKGLKPEQFTISEDGKEQKISSVDYFDVERIETAASGDNGPLT